jgi:hypothetical protein
MYFPEYFWLKSECLVSEHHLKLYCFRMFMLCIHITCMMPPLFPKNTTSLSVALEILWSVLMSTLFLSAMDFI